MNRPKQKRRAAILVPYIVLFGILAAASIQGIMFENDAKEPQKSTSTRPDCIERSGIHAAIYLPNDTALIAFPDKTGSGTPSQPYVIRDIEINATGYGYGLCMMGITLYLSIINVTVFGNNDPNQGGIYMQYCSNVTLINCTTFGNVRGIRVEHCSNVQLTGNNASCNGYGLYLLNLKDCVMMRNHGSHNTVYGFFTGLFTNCILSDNYAMYNANSGFYVGSNSSVTGNYASSNAQNGFYLHYTQNSTVAENHAWNNTYNMYLSESDNNSISGNVLSEPGYPLFVYQSDDNKFVGNSFYGLVECFNTIINDWDNGSSGNFWSSFAVQYPTATNDGYTWDTPMRVFGGVIEFDYFPLVLAPGTTDLVPVANFTTNATTIATGSKVAFTFTGQGGNHPTFFKWIFGDSTPNATSANPIHQYLNPGTYTITLMITDSSGDKDTLVKTNHVVVVNNVAPAITRPGDVSYTTGDGGNAITWTVFDMTTATTTYTLYRDGVKIGSGSWSHDVPFTIPIDGLIPGTYNYTIIVDDGIGALDQDTVMVTVNEKAVGIDQAFIILASICACVIAIARWKKTQFMRA